MDVTILNLADDKDTSAENSLLHETNAMFPDSTVAGGVECFHDDTVSHLGEPMSTFSPFGILMDSVGPSDEPNTHRPPGPIPPSHAISEPLSYPEPASVDDFLFELDEGIERSLDPPLPKVTPSTRARTLFRRVTSRFSQHAAPPPDDVSAVALSVSSRRSVRTFLTQYAATLASAGAFCLEYLDERPYRIYSVRTFCESLLSSSRAVDAMIASVTRYGGWNGVLHRFLIFHIVRADGRDFYLRVDRRKDPEVPLWVFGMQGLATHLAKDTVAISGLLEHLHDYTRGREEAVLRFPIPVPLIAIAQILYAIAAESHGYGLTKENCWFFTSMIQDILVRDFGAQYQSGSLNHPTLAKARRVLILTQAYREARNEFDHELVKITTLIGDPTLADIVKFCLHALKDAQKIIYIHSVPHFSRRFGGMVQELLITLHQMLHEHLHACCGIQGARVLSSPIELLDNLANLKRTLPISLDHSIPSEDEIDNAFGAVSSTTMSANVPLHCSSYTYKSIQREPLSSSVVPSNARELALFALELLLGCTTLSEMPEIWRFQLNGDIPELRTEFAKRISTQFLFMCRHWIDFLCEADCTDDEVMAALSRTIPSLRHWVAVMGFMDEMELVCRALKALYVWLDLKEVVDTKQIIYDLYRWVMHSTNTIVASSLSILGTGHPFIPSDSSLYRAFSGGMANQCRIVAGHMNSNEAWPSQIFKIRISDFVSHAVFSSDGCHLAGASSDGIVHVWDTATGVSLQEFKESTMWVLGVAFSPDGRHLASASTDHTVRLWDVVTRDLLQELKGHKGEVNFVVFSPDGHHLASASHDHSVHVWDAAMGVSLQEFRGHTGWVWCVTFSPDGRHLASGSHDSTVRIWDAAKGQCLQVLKGHTSSVRSVAFSPDGYHLASASIDRTVQVWDVATGASLQLLKGHTNWVMSVAFSPDGRYLASASHDYTLRIWDATTGAPLQVHRGHTDWVQCIAFSPDSRHLASTSFDQTVRMWDVAIGALFREVPGHTKAVNSIAFSRDGSHLVSTSEDRTVRVWDVKDGRFIAQKMLDGAWCPREVLFSTGGSALKIRCTQCRPLRKPLEKFRYLDFPSLETIVLSLSPSLSSASFRPIPPQPTYLDQNSLCTKHQDVTLRICWLPDYFEPTTPVAQYRNHVCVGGKDGEIAFINLEGLRIPDI